MTHQAKTKANHAAKKAAVLNAPKSKRSFVIILAAVLLAATGFLAFHLTNPGKPVLPRAAVTGADAPTVTSEAVIFPAGLFADGKAHFFEHKADGLTIRYFILKSSDGIIRSAFDACDVCWPANKGYHQEGDKMVCDNCGQRFASVLVNEVQGGCNPAPLTRSLEGDKLIIRFEDLVRGKSYFNL